VASRVGSTTHAKDRQEIDFLTIAGNNILASHVQVVRDLFDGALPLSYVTFPFLKRPLERLHPNLH
jgi:hypothetical protein